MVTRSSYREYLNPSRANYILVKSLLVVVVTGILFNLNIRSKSKLNLEQQLYLEHLSQCVEYIFYVVLACGMY